MTENTGAPAPGRLDVREITGPMHDAIARLSIEVSDAQARVAAIEEAAKSEVAQIQREASERGAHVFKEASEKAQPHAQLIADKQAAISRFQLLIAREEHAAASSTTATATDLPTAEQDGGQP